MSNKGFALSGYASAFLLATTYFIMANMRPEYSFRYKAISELGSVDAPHLWYWNIFGYVIPGVLIAGFAFGLYKYSSDASDSKTPLYSLILSGLLMSFSGIFPADMENRQSTTALLHMTGSFGSFLSFLVAAFTYPKIWRKNGKWKAIIRPAGICVWATIIFGFWPMIFPHIPSVGQRLIFLFYFLWIIIAATQLWKNGENNSHK
ncbi:MAG: DUF998 domain-containing protein [Kaistella sp.]|nr:DUF998 domain-containing protein [Kaistella sp.]